MCLKLCVVSDMIGCLVLVESLTEPIRANNIDLNDVIDIASIDVNVICPNWSYVAMPRLSRDIFFSNGG